MLHSRPTPAKTDAGELLGLLLVLGGGSALLTYYFLRDSGRPEYSLCLLTVAPAVICAAFFASPAWRFKFADNPLMIMWPLLASGGAYVAIAVTGAIGTVVWDKIGSKEQAPAGWQSRGGVRIAAKRPMRQPTVRGFWLRLPLQRTRWPRLVHETRSAHRPIQRWASASRHRS